MVLDRSPQGSPVTPERAHEALPLLSGDEDNIESPQWEPLSDVEEQAGSETGSQSASEISVSSVERRRRRRKVKGTPVHLAMGRVRLNPGQRRVRLGDEEAWKHGKEEANMSSKEMKKDEASTDDSAMSMYNIIKW